MQCAVMYFPCNIQNGIVFHVGNKIGREVISQVHKCKYYFLTCFYGAMLMMAYQNYGPLLTCLCVCIYKFKWQL